MNTLTLNTAPWDSSAKTAGALPFGDGNGVQRDYQLLGADGRPVFNLGGVAPTVWRYDWQGSQLLYTTPRTNYCLQSRSLATTPWSSIAAGTGSAVVVTANYAAAPDGSITADRLQCNRGAGNSPGDYSILRQPSSLVSNGVSPVVDSLWLKSNTGVTQLVFFGLNGGSDGVRSVTTEWQRFFYTRPAPTVGQQYLIDVGSYGLYPTGNNSIDILAWEGQLEPGTLPTSNILDTGATPVTVTDYVVSASGLVSLAQAPVGGAQLSWSGTYYLQNNRWDLTTNAGGDIAMSTGPAAIAQDVGSQVLLFQGELYFDTTQGIPYFNDILGQGLNKPLLQAHWNQAALLVPGVVQAQSVITGFEGRGVTGDVMVIDEDGQALNARFPQAAP